MIALFSCRNCIHNAGQSLNIGAGHGYCMKHHSVLTEPSTTTCKYQHRKDLPSFVVDEGRSEHAAEFANFTSLVSLTTRRAVPTMAYSERFYWENRKFDAVTSSLSNYSRAEKSWVYIQSFAGSIDGRRSLVHGCLSRRYLDNCGTWRSSYRIVLSLVQGMTIFATFDSRQLAEQSPGSPGATAEEAWWDLFFVQLSGLQEYGWHAGLESIMWASDTVNGALSELDRSKLEAEITAVAGGWSEEIIRHAKDNDQFFTPAPLDDPDRW